MDYTLTNAVIPINGYLSKEDISKVESVWNAIPRPSEIKWLSVCTHASQQFSTCSRRCYFAVVLSPEGRVVGTGYNGAPPGLPHCVDGGCPRGATGDGVVPHGAGYGDCTANHAESNALLWSDRTARLGGTLVVNGPPCWDCSKLIAGSGIRRVVHFTDPEYADWTKCKQLLSDAGIQIVSVEMGSE